MVTYNLGFSGNHGVVVHIYIYIYIYIY